MFWPGASEAAGYIHRIAVRRDVRGSGLELLKFAERITADTGRKLLRLDCFAGNAALCSYYERAGFAPDGASHTLDGLGGVTEIRYRRVLPADPRPGA